jgi:hypothetical protein
MPLEIGTIRRTPLYVALVLAFCWLEGSPCSANGGGTSLVGPIPIGPAESAGYRELLRLTGEGGVYSCAPESGFVELIVFQGNDLSQSSIVVRQSGINEESHSIQLSGPDEMRKLMRSGTVYIRTELIEPIALVWKGSEWKSLGGSWMPSRNGLDSKLFAFLISELLPIRIVRRSAFENQDGFSAAIRPPFLATYDPATTRGWIQSMWAVLLLIGVAGFSRFVHRRTSM